MDESLAAKRHHVKASRQTRRHVCHWPGCEVQVPPAMWGCKTHWFKLPKRLRDRIWHTYEAGQEERLDPSPEYLEAAKLAQRWIDSYLKGER